MIDWKPIYKKHKGNWVAFAADERTVLASGKTVRETLLKAMKKSTKTPILTRMPDSLESFVGAL